jgi:hypothetical protein
MPLCIGISTVIGSKKMGSVKNSMKLFYYLPMILILDDAYSSSDDGDPTIRRISLSILFDTSTSEDPDTSNSNDHVPRRQSLSIVPELWGDNSAYVNINAIRVLGKIDSKEDLLKGISPEVDLFIACLDEERRSSPRILPEIGSTSSPRSPKDQGIDQGKGLKRWSTKSTKASLLLQRTLSRPRAHNATREI